MRFIFFSSVLSLFALPGLADGGSAPSLQWVRSLAASGQNLAIASTSDSQGNLYITGSTSALDFPTASAWQAQPGGSPLTRVDTASGRAQKLYSPLLSTANSFAVDPRNPATLYAVSATAAGMTDTSNTLTTSLIRSTDAGGTWNVVSTMPTASYSCIAVDPLAPSVIYACGGYQGLYKSVDDGITWVSIGNLKPVFDVWADPRTPSVVFTETNGTLLRSADGGATWSTVLSNVYNSGASSIAFDPFAPGTIYEAGHTVVNKSTDDGQTWTPMNAPPALVDFVWVDPAHANVLYFAALANNGGLYQSIDGGLSWTRKADSVVTWLAFDARGTGYAITGVISGSVLVSNDGFNTYGHAQAVRTASRILPSGSSVFAASSATTDVFVAKYDPDGNVVYSTYFGGSANDKPAGIAVASDGSVYVAGNTQSSDFPTTAGTFLPDAPTNGGSFVFKLNPDGGLAWSTFIADNRTSISSIALNSNGEAYATGNTYGGLPITPGAFLPDYPVPPCSTGGFMCLGGTAGFLARFKADGSGLIASTYVKLNSALPSQVLGLAVDANGNAYTSAYNQAFVIAADATSQLATATLCRSCTIRALALDSAGNLYTAGSGSLVPTTPGAFQTVPQPLKPALPTDYISPLEAFVIKTDANLQLLAATYLGGEFWDQANSIAIDANGNVLVAGNASSKAFPTKAPFELPFSAQSGFVAALDANLTTLLYSTFLGDRTYFNVAGAFPDAQGNVLLAGSTMSSPANSGCLPMPCLSGGVTIYANKISLAPAPAPRLDSVGNAASQLANGVSAGESIAAIGVGFADDAELLLDGVPLPIESRSAARIVANVPMDWNGSDTATVTVSSDGQISNPVMMPVMAAAPGVYSADGTGYGQGYILNSDGTLNSPSNPAPLGSAITIFATGVGPLTQSGDYAIAGLPISVFIDGFYANGIAASIQSVPGLATNAYAISVYVPNPAALVANNPDLKNFKMPPQVSVFLVAGQILPANPAYSGSRSQAGLALSVSQ